MGRMMMKVSSIFFFLFLPCQIISFSSYRNVFKSRNTFEPKLATNDAPSAFVNANSKNNNGNLCLSLSSSEDEGIRLNMTLTDKKTRDLFAWVSRAFQGDSQYNNLALALAACFGTNVKESDDLYKMRENAVLSYNNTVAQKKGKDGVKHVLMGQPVSRFERERSSLGAMGAAQWTGQWKTRPHSLLKVDNFTTVEDWIKILPRGCKRTLKKANAQNFTVVTKPIEGGKAAPHSSYEHFKCVLEHEVRLYFAELKSEVGSDEISYADEINNFLYALSAATNRYISTTTQAGQIQEYIGENGRVLGFAHTIIKGKTIRGQWFYASDEGAKRYVWFHSVQELVRAAVETYPFLDCADLGPSGSDDFADLKERYGFEEVDDWPAVADYMGPFFYPGEKGDGLEQELLNSGENNDLVKALLAAMRGEPLDD